MTLETRALPGAEMLNLDQERHRVEARVLRYHVSDAMGTVWKPGCLTESFRANPDGPTICAFHDMSRPIGRVIDHRDNDDALELTIQLGDVEAVPDARAAYSLLKDGIVRNWSVGFSRTKWDPVPSDQRSAYGEHPAKEFMHAARLAEVSMVSQGAVPGTATLAIRAEDAGLVVVTMEDIERQFDKGLLGREEARAMLADLLPEHRLRIVMSTAAAAPVVEIPAKPTEPAEAATEPGEARAGAAMPMVPVAPASDDSDEDADDVATLAASTDAALDSAVYWLSKSSPEDLAGLPDNIQQAVALVQAASVVVDDLLDALGIADPDDPDEMEGSGDDSGRSVEASEVASDEADAAPEAREDPEAEVEERTLSTKAWDPKPADYTPAQWKAACLIWSGPAGEVGSGSLPVLEPDGSPNRAGMAAAAARLNQVDAPDDAKKAAAKKLLALYGSNKLKAPGSLLQAARSVDDPETRAIVVEAVDSELDDLFGRLGGKAA